jgi:hypothetical protein
MSDTPFQRIAAAPSKSLEQLAGEAVPDVAIPWEELHRIADFARRLQQRDARARGALDVDLRPYMDLDPARRDSMALGVARVVQALQMLGWIGSP